MNAVLSEQILVGFIIITITNIFPSFFKDPHTYCCIFSSHGLKAQVRFSVHVLSCINCQYIFVCSLFPLSDNFFFTFFTSSPETLDELYDIDICRIFVLKKNKPEALIHES